MSGALPPRPPDLFYPIVPDVDWVARLVPLGVRTIQLRVKGRTNEDTRRQIAACLEICRDRCQLIVNDYWREAIDAGAGYVHLGQEDLSCADLAALRTHDVAFGISTHSRKELETALAAKPNYVALGPIWGTKLKAMAWSPQGLERIAEWKRHISDLPLVAIGGITLDRAGSVLAAGAQSASVITDFLSHSDPDGRVAAWLAWAGTHRP